MKVNTELLKSLIKEGIRNNQAFSVHRFLTKEEQSDQDVDDVVSLLIERLDPERLKEHANINKKIL